MATAAAPAPDEAPKPKKKKKGKKGLFLILGVLLLGGGGAGAFIASPSLFGTKAEDAQGKDLPQLLAKGSKPKAAEGEGGGGGGDGPKYESSYFQLEKDFTSNLKDSSHLIQVGLAVSTPYDEKVIEHLKGHELAVRSAVLMTLSDTDEEQIFSTEGKRDLQRRLVKAINDVLKEKEGFGGVGNVYFTNFIVQ
jgi:flagellar protein FliL